MTEKITIDLETRSRKDLGDCGPWAYAEDPSTEALCLASKIHHKPVRMWVPDKWLTALELSGVPYITQEELWQQLIETAIIEAQNAEFETAIWHHVLHGRGGWKDILELKDKLRCSAAKASTCSLPRDLDTACDVLRLREKKDMEGHAMMVKVSSPRRITKKNPNEWVEDDASLARVFRYCAQDVVAEEGLSDALPDLSPTEQRVWQLDQAINRRGVPVDLMSVDAMIRVTDAHKSKLLVEFGGLTKGAFESPAQIDKFKNHLANLGVRLEDLSKNTVLEALKLDIPPVARRMLEIRQSVGKSSVSKYTALRNGASLDERLRSLLRYHAAGTGRWGGKRFQPQNLPREGLKDYELLLSVLNQEFPPFDHMDDAQLAEAIETYWADPMFVASRTVRNMIRAAQGRTLYAGDFKSIEAIVTAWIAGEQGVLQAFMAGEDLYISAASVAFNKPRSEITKDERQVGKVIVLALGYQGGVGAFTTLGVTYNVLVLGDKEELPRDTKGQIILREAQVKAIIKNWREANPTIVRFWKQIQAAAIAAIQQPGSESSYNGIKFRMWNNFLCLRLPSGRVLYYYQPRVVPKTIVGENEDGTTYEWETIGIQYMGMDSTTHQWCKQDTHGGKLTENIVQAISRDILATSMLTVEELGYSVVLTVHDEIVSETAEDFGSVEEFNKAICILPTWASGLPLMAESWKGYRYRK